MELNFIEIKELFISKYVLLMLIGYIRTIDMNTVELYTDCLKIMKRHLNVIKEVETGFSLVRWLV